MLLGWASAFPFGAYNLDRGLSEGGINNEEDPVSSEGGLNIDRGPDSGAGTTGVERTVGRGVKGFEVGGVGLTVGGVAGEGGRAAEFDVCVVR